MKFNIEPHSGANDIKLGMPRQEVRQLLGKPEFTKESTILEFAGIVVPETAKDGYLHNELQITYDEDEKATLIEFYGYGAKQTEVYLYNRNVFETPALELLRHIQNTTNVEFDAEDEETPYSYVFRDIDLAVWRQVVPEIEENSSSIPESDEEKFFWTIGIGVKGYYKEE